VYHRAYKSAREDQIGFQKYKIHTAILKNKSEAASTRETKERIPGEEGKEINRNEGTRGGRGGLCQRRRNAR